MPWPVSRTPIYNIYIYTLYSCYLSLYLVARSAQLNADNMIPLTMLCMLRAAVPHLGAELALLDDLTGGPNFQAEMSGMAGYCYTTLKAAYEHVTMRALQRAAS